MLEQMRAMVTQTSGLPIGSAILRKPANDGTAGVRRGAVQRPIEDETRHGIAMSDKLHEAAMIIASSIQPTLAAAAQTGKCESLPRNLPDNREYTSRRF